MTWLKQKYFASSENRVEFFPVEWRSSLKLDGGNLHTFLFNHGVILRMLLIGEVNFTSYQVDTTVTFCGDKVAGV